MIADVGKRVVQGHGWQFSKRGGVVRAGSSSSVELGKVRRRRRETWGHREEREAMRRGQASADRAPRDASEVAVEPALGNEFLHGATEPVASVAVAETLLEEGFEYRGRAVRVVPDKVLGVKPRPILFEDTVVGFEVAPHFSLRVRGHDGDLGDVEFVGSEGAKILRRWIRPPRTPGETR